MQTCCPDRSFILTAELLDTLQKDSGNSLFKEQRITEADMEVLQNGRVNPKVLGGLRLRFWCRV